MARLLDRGSLDDGSVFIVYQLNGGHKPEHMKSQSIFSLRFKVKPDCSGIELLPAVPVATLAAAFHGADA